jgi:protease I
MTTRSVLILAGPEYEDLELWYPKLRLEEAGFAAPVAGLGDARYLGKWGYPAAVDTHIRDVDVDGLAGVVVPGGWAPDKLRRSPEVLDCVRRVHEAGKLVATICHGPWVLISARIVRGRTLTSTVGIRDDVENAGATWVNAPVVTDGNIVSSRVPSDLPVFGAAIVEWLSRH